MLDAVQARIVGSLIEKQLVTPQHYPLTLNALVAACNQTSNRDPVVSFDERSVADALTSLKERHLVRFVLPSHGRSVVRYREVIDESLGLDIEQLALLSLLLLRGPQTVGELRSRAERLAPFDGTAAVERALTSLAAAVDGMVRQLPRRPGQKEERWVEVFSGGSRDDPGADTQGPPPLPGAIPAPASSGTAPRSSPGTGDIEVLRLTVASLADRVDQLEARLAKLQDELGG
jgi:uncharacterized protein YceH (UPF0502 family)